MIYWITKIFSLLTVVALLMGLAATMTTLMGDVRSLTVIPTDRDAPYGLMLAVKKTKGPGKEIKCQAYAWGTDFNQRPGAIFHAGFYHAVVLLGLLAMLVHQGLRGIIPAVLPTLFKFVPALQGQSGLAGSGAVMIYVGLQIASYSVGKLHLLSAAALIVIGLLNIGACFFPLFVSASATLPPPAFGSDPFGDDGMGGFPPGGGGGMDEMMGGGAGGPPGPGAPDPYADPYGEAGGGKGDGVGAGSAPPGAIDRRGNDDDDEEDEGKMVYDPRTGLWSTRGKGVPANPIVGGMMGMGMPPMGYGMYGMNPYGAAGYMPNTVPAQQGGEDLRSSKDIKKAIKKQARKELKRLKRKEAEEEESESGSESDSEDDDGSSRRSARGRWRDAAHRARGTDADRERAFERQIREEEKRRQMVARGIAMQDARQRAAQEVAEEDARMRNCQDMLDNQREMAMTDAQRLAFQNELQDMRDQQALLLARRRAEIDAAERERQDQVLYRQPPNQPNYYQPSPMSNNDNAAQYYQGQQQPRRFSVTPSLPPYQPAYSAADQQSTRMPLKYPGQASAPPSYAGSHRARQAAGHAYPPQNPQQQYFSHQPQNRHPQVVQEEEEEYDFDDDITEIQSVRSETSSQRRLVRQRMEEERERVLMTQSLEQRFKTPGAAPAYAEMDIVDDYRSGGSAGSSARSRGGRRRPGWRA